MPATSKKTFKADELVVAGQPAAALLDDGSVFTVKTGDRYKANHAIVVKLGRDVFVEDGTAQNEMPSPFDDVVETAKQNPKSPATGPAPRLDPETPLRDLVICVWESSGSPSCDVGTVLHRDDALVRRLPEAFVALSDRLGVRRP